jgi:hypothetical protein
LSIIPHKNKIFELKNELVIKVSPKNIFCGLFGTVLWGKLVLKRNDQWAELSVASGNAEKIMLENKQYVKYYTFLCC